MVLISILLSSCAVKDNYDYYPLKNNTYFLDPVEKDHKAVIMPFNVYIHTNYSSTNTLEMHREKSREARNIVVNAIAQELARTQYDITGYISFDEVIKDDFNTEVRLIIDDLLYELSNAGYSIWKNLEDEEGKGFDYSIGIRAREIAGLFNNKPDVLVFLYVRAFVRDLTASESNADNVEVAVIALRKSKVEATPDDITSVKITLVDANTGDIIWMDAVFAHGKSVLRPGDANFVAKKLMRNLSIKKLQQSMSYVE